MDASGRGATAVHLAAAREGDRQSLGWLVERFDPMLHAAARWHLSGRLARVLDPDDLVHEVWVVALSRLRAGEADRLTTAPAFLAFVATTMRHLVNNLLRRHLRGELPREVAGALGDEPSAAMWRDEVTSVTRGLAVSEARERFAAALASLDDVDRGVVVLRGLERCSARDTATVLGLTEGTVAVRFHRALKKLKDRLGDAHLDELAAD